VLDDIAQHGCTALVAVPVMLKRLLAVESSARPRIIVTGGAQLGGPLATQLMDAFGDVVYNLYGSTEAAYATIATPADLRAAPACVGRPPYGTTVRILDADGSPARSGRIFVGNVIQSSGYTGGGGKQIVDGLMSTGDVGHFDDVGRLFVDGRDDDMIVSGGENVFPGEVTDLLVGHPAIADAVVVGVPDDEFGQALRAYVVSDRLTEDDVRDHVKANLARYKVPRTVVFVDALPRNAAGKVVTRELPILQGGSA
jgi:fatty-acyl-CoA synthase